MPVPEGEMDAELGKIVGRVSVLLTKEFETVPSPNQSV